MICFPNAKINLGLHILRRRPDGYHDIETVFYPIPWQDALELRSSEEFCLRVEGLAIDGNPENNLVAKAYRLLEQNFNLTPVEVCLFKNIPFGAGLGGGSADAAFLLKALNETQSLGLDENHLEAYASKLGADCAFFIRNRPMFASGIGNRFQAVNLPLKGRFVVVVKPGFQVSTAEAYSLVSPREREVSLLELVQAPITCWKGLIINDFEEKIAQRYPLIGELRDSLYRLGAMYASMSGSGSAVYGLFDREPADWENAFPGMACRGGYLD